MPMPRSAHILGISIPTPRSNAFPMKMIDNTLPPTTTASSSAGSISESEPSLDPSTPDREDFSEQDDSAYDEPLFLDHYLTSEDESMADFDRRVPSPPALVLKPTTSPEEPYIWGFDNPDDGWYGPSGSMDFYDDIDMSFSIHDVRTTTITIVPPRRAKVVYVSPPPSPFGSSEHSRSTSLDGSDTSTPTSESPPESISESSDLPHTPDPGDDYSIEDLEEEPASSPPPPPIPERSSTHKLNRRGLAPPRIYTDVKPFAQKLAQSAQSNRQSISSLTPRSDYFGAEQWAVASVPQMAKRGSIGNASTFSLRQVPSLDSLKKATQKRTRSLRPKLPSPSFFKN